MNRRPRAKINGESNVSSSRGFWKLGRKSRVLKGVLVRCWSSSSLVMICIFIFRGGFWEWSAGWMSDLSPTWLVGGGGWTCSARPLSTLQPNHGVGCLSRLQRSSGHATSNMLLWHLNYLDLKLHKIVGAGRAPDFPIPLKNGPSMKFPMRKMSSFVLGSRGVNPWHQRLVLLPLYCLTAEC